MADEQKPVEVTQADREAAARLLRRAGRSKHFAEAVVARHADADEWVQAFARHRTSHAAPRLSDDLVERLRNSGWISGNTNAEDDAPWQAADRIESDAATIRGLVEALWQYESDLLHPPTGDSRERRLERVRKVIAEAESRKPK